MTTSFNRQKMPVPASPRPFHFPDFTEHRLSNGLQLMIAEHRLFPLVGMHFGFRFGAALDPPGKEGLAALMSEMLLEGIPGKNAHDIASFLEMTGVHYSVYSDFDGIFCSFNTLQKHWKPVADLFLSLLRKSIFPETEFSRIRRELVIERMRVLDMADRLNSELFYHFLYEGQRLARPADGLTASLENIVRQDLLALFGKIIQPQNAFLIVSGDIRSEEIIHYFEGETSDWSGNLVESPAAPSIRSSVPGRMLLVPKDNARQTELLMGHEGFDRHHPDFYAAYLLNEIYGGYFLSRLNQKIREEKGFTYNINSKFSFRSLFSVFRISAAIESEHSAEALQLILDEMKRLQEERVPAEELEQARGYISGMFPSAFETAAQIASGLSSIALHRLPPDYFNTFREKIAAVTSEEIRSVAQRRFQPDQMLTVISNNPEIIGQQFGSVEGAEKISQSFLENRG